VGKLPGRLPWARSDLADRPGVGSVQVLDETAHQKLLAAIDVAVSKVIDVYNLASEGGDEELADFARAQVHQLQEFREAARARPTRRARWLSARTPRGDARAR
jgi:hypothetical protein